MSSSVNKKFLWLLLALVVLAYVLLKLFMPATVGFGVPAGMAVPVGVATVQERSITEWKEYAGRLVPVESAQVRAQVGGVIQAIHFKDGALVKKGAPLITIDPRPYEAALQAASATATFAEAEFKRAETLIAEKAMPQREFDMRKQARESARAALAKAKLDLEYTKVKAPISGRVGRAELTVGNLVETVPNAPVLTTIVAGDRFYADFDIEEASFVKYAKAGISGSQNTADIPVMLALSGEDTFTHSGQIASFDNQVHLASGTVRVRAVFDNPDGLLMAGMFARVRLGSAKETPALLVDERAIGTDQSKKFVIVVGPDNKTEHREVTLGDQHEGMRIITGGLKAGETIVVSGLQRIMMPGQEVKPEEISNVENQISKESGEQNAAH